ncbi:response regulator [Methanolobus sp. WCC5]|uniref:response regulator n=1 Tax=Methanolobus sp. WCC5 TaxID=3125785 RepID=UPI0032501485
MKLILVVEDNIENMELIVCLLKLKDYGIKIATDGAEAVELSKRYNFDLIILDIYLPIMNGFEVLKRLKHTINSNTPVVAVTASILEGNKELLLAAGCSECLEKPFNTDVFYKTISFYCN